MSNQLSFSSLRGLFIFLCLLLIGAAIVRYAASPSLKATVSPPDQLPPPVVSNHRVTTPEPSPTHPPKQLYTINPTPPYSGENPNFTVLMDECHRGGDLILCTGKITDNTDAPTRTQLRDSTAVDDEGNAIFVGSFGGGVSFVGANSMYGNMQRLMPGVPTKFRVTIDDPHRNVRFMNLQLVFDWTSNSELDTLLFKKLPVQ
jgi:hypothetical protein